MFLNIRDQVSHPYRTTDKIIALYTYYIYVLILESIVILKKKSWFQDFLICVYVRLANAWTYGQMLIQIRYLRLLLVKRRCLMNMNFLTSKIWAVHMRPQTQKLWFP
jgi:hypothetical protein